MMKGDIMSAVYWVQQCHGGKDASRAGGLMRLMGVSEDRSGWFFQVKNTLADGLMRWDLSTLTEELTNRWLDVK